MVEVVRVDKVWDVSVEMFSRVVVKTVAIVTVRPLSHHPSNLGSPTTTSSSSYSSSYQDTSEKKSILTINFFFSKCYLGLAEPSTVDRVEVELSVKS